MKSCLFLLLITALLFSCRVEPDFDELSSELIVSTSLDKTVNYSNYKTFYISDTIMYVGGVADGGVLVGPEANKLIQAVKDNLISRGYQYTNRRSNPDIGLTLSAVKDINVVVDYYYPGWWDGYWPSCYWSCYPYYYPWNTYYSYTTGTVILTMFDLKNAREKGQITGIWNTTALGALGSTSAVNTALGIDAINQGFEQSPYLKAN